MSAPPSALLDALATLARAGIECVVVGTSGINFYARNASEAVVTEDVDVFLPPRLEVLRSALRVLHAAEFRFAVREEPFLDFDDDATLANLIRAGVAIVAERDGSRLDLMLSGSGLDYDDLASDAVSFRLGDFVIRVGRLEKLLRSKERAGRPKDVEFLRLFAARLRGAGDADS